MRKITVVDYGSGNLRNVMRALEHIGAVFEVTSDAGDIGRAERLLLPGVGAFGDCMHTLARLGLTQALIDYMHQDRLYLGICVGMQILFDVGREFGDHRGLGIIPGRVVRIPDKGVGGTPHKAPHVGWGVLQRPPPLESWKNTILEPLESLEGKASAYFVHSYMGVPDDPRHRVANVDYDGIPICAVVRHGNVRGCQFHPEKSGELGLAILQHFLEM